MFTKSTVSQSMIDAVNSILEEEKKQQQLNEASTFDWKSNKNETDPKFTTKKAGERTGHESKKTEKGTMYTKKPLRSDGQEFKKEETEMDFKERLLEKNWIAGAIKKPGAETAAAKKAGMGVQAYAHKHAHDSGKSGQRARLAITLSKLKKEEATFDELLEDLNDAQVDKIIYEVLAKDADAGDYIHDFIHSKNPKFAGKSKEMRKKMALGAYYGKHNEEVKLDEANKESKKDFDARQARLAAASKETAKDPMRLKRLSSIPGYTAAMDLAKKTTKEELIGGQKKIDKNHNGKIDAQDFKILRGQKQQNEGMMDAVKKVGGKVLKTLGHGSDADMMKDLAKKTGVNPPPKTKTEEAGSPESFTDTLAGRVKGGKPNQHSSIKVKLKAEAVEKDNKPPFDGPYTKVKGTVKDKSGAVHTPMSHAKHLAKMAMKKVKNEMIGKTGTSE